MSGFSSLNTAVTGLAAAQRAMDVTGQNVVNANTPGYSRQRVDLREIGAPVTATLFTGHGAAIGGVTVADVARIKDAFIEGARAAAGGRRAALSSQTAALDSVQQLLAEPGNTGLQATMDAFYASWHDLANNPTDSAAGSVVIQRGIAVTDQVRSISSGIAGQWATAHDALANVVAQVNRAASDLADVNAKISSGLVAGLPVNELEDQRDVLSRTLAELVGGTAVIGQDGTASVAVNGVSIVAGTTAQQLTLAGSTTLTGAAANPPKIMWGTTAVPVDSGSAAGYLAVLGTDLPAAAQKVDTLATSLRDLVNGVHATGFQADGTPGGLFFDGTDALSLQVVPTDPGQLAITPTAGTVDGSVALKIGDLSDDQVQLQQLGSTGPTAQWRNFTSQLGVRVQSLKNAGAVQDSVVAAADTAVETDSGVNLDEEMTGMLQFQRSYQAAARVVTTVDEILDTLINHTAVG